MESLKQLGSKKPLHIGRATELSGFDYILYRFFEIMPGALSWLTLIACLVLSFFYPITVAVFIIAFDFYWVLKTIFLSIHLRHNWKRMRHNMKLDWNKRIEEDALPVNSLRHLVILPFYNESQSVVERSIQALLDSTYDTKKMLVVLASEERAGEPASLICQNIKNQYAHNFQDFLITVHPKDIEGELAGKGSNIAYAIEQARLEMIDPQELSYENIVVSAFDIDTVVYPQYFSCLSWYFLTHPNPHKASFQPVPLYNNNIWDAPALSRVVAVSGTFWQMIQQERPERLTTFSSHSVSFKTLFEIGYWQRNMVSEDSRIFWNAFIGYGGDYEVVPISYPVSLDANLAPSFWKTTKNIYKQHRRWSWGVENIPYVLFSFVKDKSIPLRKKLFMSFVQIEGFWSLATNPLIIFLLGWAPLVFGGDAFNSHVIAYNLPIFTRNLMLVAMLGLVTSAIISFSFLPPRPKGYGRHRFVFMALQWVLIPITIPVFGALPGLESQTRLLLGKYMGFWVTPKHRKNN